MTRDVYRFLVEEKMAAMRAVYGPGDPSKIDEVRCRAVAAEVLARFEGKRGTPDFAVELSSELRICLWPHLQAAGLLPACEFVEREIATFMKRGS